jgi:hypothetical protein
MGWWAPERLAHTTVALGVPANIPRPGYFRRPRAGALGGAR